MVFTIFIQSMIISTLSLRADWAHTDAILAFAACFIYRIFSR